MELAWTPTERAARYRERKRSELLCIEGGCWEHSGEFERCEAHAARQAGYQRKRRRDRREDQPDDTEAA